MADFGQKTVEKPGGKKVTYHSRQGAPPGNLNRCHHPWRVLMTKGALRQQDKWVLKIIAQYRKELERDNPSPTSSEARLMELCALARGCVSLILQDMNETDELNLVELERYIKLELSLLNKLGIRKDQKVESSLAEEILRTSDE